MMNYYLTEEQMMIKDLCHKIGVEKIKPVREHYDETGEFPWDIIKLLAEADICGVYIPAAYGGLGGGVMEMVIATEEFLMVLRNSDVSGGRMMRNAIGSRM